MKTKRFFAQAGAIVFLLSVLFLVQPLGYAMDPQPEPPMSKAKPTILPYESFTATIIKIEGNKITVRDDKGMEKIIAGSPLNLKVGDKVRVNTRDGRTWLNPQPEPPAPAKTTPLAL